MFDIFGIKARKKAKEEAMIALAQAKKQEYLKRKETIESYLKEYYSEKKEEQREKFLSDVENARKKNETCPHCGSKNVVQKVVRTKGEIHGKGSSSISGSLSGGFFVLGGSVYGSGNSKIDGNMDTFPINKCNDCGNEWNIAEAHMVDWEDEFSTNSTAPFFLYYDLKKYFDLRYDPKDFKNEFNSLEEMRENLIKDSSKSWHFDKLRKSPRFMIEYAFFNEIKEQSYYIELNEKKFGIKNDDDAYSYTMPEELWELVKKIIGWEENYYVKCDVNTTTSWANTQC